MMLQSIDEDEKVVRNAYTLGGVSSIVKEGIIYIPLKFGLYWVLKVWFVLMYVFKQSLIQANLMHF